VSLSLRYCGVGFLVGLLFMGMAFGVVLMMRIGWRDKGGGG
jgi:hypothetical protein